jgi:hypothetical protein
LVTGLGASLAKPCRRAVESRNPVRPHVHIRPAMRIGSLQLDDIGHSPKLSRFGTDLGRG